MITKNDVVRMARHIVRTDQGKTDRSLMHPQREWNISILLGVMFLVIGITFSSMSFLHHRSVLSDNSVTEVKSVNYREQLVDQTISYYGAKQASYDNLYNEVIRNTRPVIEDIEVGVASSTATTTEIEIDTEPEEEEVAIEEENQG